jgi:hypothetical protein
VVHRYASVIVAVTSMGVMQMVSNKVIHVIAVRHSLVRTVWTMDMSLIMSATRMVGSASVRIGRADLEDVFVYMLEVRVMQVGVMQIVGMISVCDRHMTTRRAMLMCVILMFRARHSGLLE